MQLLTKATISGPGRACAGELLDALPTVMWRVRGHMRSFRKGLSLAQFRTLVLIDGRPEANLSDVAECLGSSPPTASRIVAGLVARGLLARSDCPRDRRQLSLATTARGRTVLNEAWRGTQDRLAGEIAGWPPEDRDAVVRAMRVLKQTFGSVGLAARRPARPRTAVAAAAAAR